MKIDSDREKKRAESALQFVWFDFIQFYCCCLSYVDVKISWQTLTPSARPLCAYATVHRHLNTTYDPNRLRFLQQISIAAAAQTTIVTPTDDIQRLDSNCASPASTSPSSYASPSSPCSSYSFSNSPSFPRFHFLPHLKCHCKCVWRLWLTFVCLLSLGLASVFLPLPRTATPPAFCTDSGKAFVFVWHSQGKMLVDPGIVYTWDANSSFCYALEIFY